jgi:hypothetical protein
MRQVREVLRLKFVGGVPTREIARRVGVAASTVRATLKRFQATGLSWPLPEELSDAALEARLFAEVGTKRGHRRLAEPDWAAIHHELKRKHVTLAILWDEYIERNPEGYRYSRFCELYRAWEARLSITMRQTHVGGDKGMASEQRWLSRRRADAPGRLPEGVSERHFPVLVITTEKPIDGVLTRVMAPFGSDVLGAHAKWRWWPLGGRFTGGLVCYDIDEGTLVGGLRVPPEEACIAKLLDLGGEC